MATLERLGVQALRDTVVTFRDALVAHAPALNRLNVYPVPDGDTGTNMSRTLEAVVAELDGVPDDLAATCQAISHGSLMGARGNSGVILSQILRGLAGVLAGGDGGPGTVASGLQAAAGAAYQAVLKPIEGTILTVAREAADAAVATSEGGGGLPEVLAAAREAGGDALARTPDLLPVLAQAGVVDAGGAGYLLLLDAALHVVAGRPLPEPDEAAGASVEALEAVAHRHRDGEVDVSELRYEVMFFLDLADGRVDGFRHAWGDIGDSIVVVGGDGLWNCHIHTNDVGAAIEAALDQGGRPSKIRVTDLFEEVDEEHDAREAALQGLHARAPRAGAGLPPVTCAVVAVSVGDGLAELFSQLGVQGLVTGGQTMNPSTAELLGAVDHVNAHEVVVLPNNKNIIPVAEQVQGLSTKTVHVVPTRSVPEALAALVVYDPEAGAAENAAEMAEAIGHVATGEITRAVRDAASPAGAVRAGDWIGLVRGEGIVAVSGSVDGASVGLLEHLVGPAHELVTVITGVDATPAATSAVTSWLREQHPGVEVEVHAGGQPLYPFLFGVE